MGGDMGKNWEDQRENKSKSGYDMWEKNLLLTRKIIKKNLNNKDIIIISCMTIKTKQTKDMRKETERKKERDRGSRSWDEDVKEDTFKRNKQLCLSRVQRCLGLWKARTKKMNTFSFPPLYISVLFCLNSPHELQNVCCL